MSYSSKGKRETDTKMHKGEGHGNRYRDWSDGSPSQGTLLIVSKLHNLGERLAMNSLSEPIEETKPAYLDFRILESRTMKEYIFVGLANWVCVTGYGKPRLIWKYLIFSHK